MSRCAASQQPNHHRAFRSSAAFHRLCPAGSLPLPVHTGSPPRRHTTTRDQHTARAAVLLGGYMGVTWACRGQRPRNRFSRVGMEINASRRDAVNCQRRDLPLFSESTSPFAGIASPMGGPCTPAKGGGQARAAGLVLRRGARDQEHIASATRKGRDPACASAVRRLCSGRLASRRVESRSHRGALGRPPSARLAARDGQRGAARFTISR